MTEMDNDIELKIRTWVEKKFNISEVEAELKASGLDEETIEANLRAFKKQKNAGKHLNGIICVIVGAVLGFLSCLLAILNPIPELFNIFLYGVTPVAILILFAGLYLLFE